MNSKIGLTSIFGDINIPDPLLLLEGARKICRDVSAWRWLLFNSSLSCNCRLWLYVSAWSFSAQCGEDIRRVQSRKSIYIYPGRFPPDIVRPQVKGRRCPLSLHLGGGAPITSNILKKLLKLNSLLKFARLVVGVTLKNSTEKFLDSWRFRSARLHFQVTK